MVIRLFFAFCCLGFSHLALAAYVVTVDVSGPNGTYPPVNWFFETKADADSNRVSMIMSVANSFGMHSTSWQKGVLWGHVGEPQSTWWKVSGTVSHRSCTVVDGGKDCLSEDEAPQECQGSDSFSISGSPLSACVTLPTGVNCQSACTSGICVDSGSGSILHEFTGRSCVPGENPIDDVCFKDSVDGSLTCYSSDFNPNPTNPPNPDSGSGSSGPIDPSTGSGGGSVSTGGGSTSGGSVDSPADSGAVTRDYTAALNRLIQNQHETNKSVLSVVNNQAHDYNVQLANKSQLQGINKNTAATNSALGSANASLTDIAGLLAGIDSKLAALESGGSGGDGGGSGGDGGDGGGSGGDGGDGGGSGGDGLGIGDLIEEYDPDAIQQQFDSKLDSDVYDPYYTANQELWDAVIPIIDGDSDIGSGSSSPILQPLLDLIPTIGHRSCSDLRFFDGINIGSYSTGGGVYIPCNYIETVRSWVGYGLYLATLALLILTFFRTEKTGG